jgi:CRP-like cAMP-binding protein
VNPAEILVGTAIFQDLSVADVAELVPRLSERHFARGESLWIEGDPAEALYVIVSGQLKSFRVSREGNEVILRLHAAREATGEVGLFHPSGRRQVNVSAMAPTVCYTLPREPMFDFLMRHPAAMRRLLEQLSSMTVHAAYSFSGVAFGDIRSRVAVALLTLGEEFGEPLDAGGLRIRLRLSQATLAALVAASRENVNRALSGFVTAGVIGRNEGHFELHDLEALRRAAVDLREQ